jgi:cobalt-zinc-cadmium efflux system membrane fusion protein
MKQLSVLALIAMFFTTACSHKHVVVENKKFVLSDTMMKMIRIDTARFCNITDELSLSGEVSFNENNVVKIFPRSSGQVIETKVSVGDKVSKGQTLAIVRSADVAGTYSDLNTAKADLAIAKRNMDNAESLYKNGISSEREYNEAKEDYQKALAVKNKAEVALTISGGAKAGQGGQYAIVSPIAGYVVEKKITTGSFIRSDATDNLFTISDLKNVWIYANVYEADIPKVKEGYSVKVTPMAYPDKSFSGKIDKVGEVLDPQSKSMRVRITLDNKDMLLKPDMFAKVTVNNEEGSKATCIPTSALISMDGKNYVVVYQSKDNMKIAEVDIIKTVGDKTFLRNGVTEGDALITKEQLFIFNQIINE